MAVKSEAEIQQLPPRSELPPFEAGYKTYLSPFTFRYGTEPMRRVWSQEHFWGLVRRFWVAQAGVQEEAGLITNAQYFDLALSEGYLSVERIFQLERDPKFGTGHDVAAAISEYSEVAPTGGKILHQGNTSEDPLSNVEILQIHESFDLLRPKLTAVLGAFGDRIRQHAGQECMGWTHLQAGEPTTVGYRLARYAQDLLVDLKVLDSLRPLIKGKGVKGAVGTSASFVELLRGTGMTAREHEQSIMGEFGLEYVTISGQTYPRKFLVLTENILSGIGGSLHNFALDVQMLQSSAIGEVSEPRRKGQIGSSAMPHKQNPINSENIDSLTEELPGMNFAAWMTGSFVTLERTLRDSAGKRSWLPESFLIVDEALTRTEKIVRGLVIHDEAIKANMRRFAPFCATEIVMAKLGEAGMDRKEAHALLVEHAETAVEAVRAGKQNPIKRLITEDQRITSLLGRRIVERAFRDIYHHVGDAPERCIDFLENELYPALQPKT